MSMSRCCVSAIAIVLLGLAASPALAGELVVTISGVKEAEGKVFVGVHRQVEGVTFPDLTGRIAGSWRIAEAGSMMFVFLDLSPGAYAVAAFHDENGNEELDTNFVGVPQEGFGFGNGAKGRFGPPDFDDAAVTVGTDKTAVAVSLTY